MYRLVKYVFKKYENSWIKYTYVFIAEDPDEPLAISDLFLVGF